MLTLAQEAEKLCVKGSAACTGFIAFFMNLPYVIESLYSLVTGLIARRPWHGEFDDSLPTIKQQFKQKFRKDDNPPHWIVANLYRVYDHGAYWEPGNPKAEIGDCKPALASPFPEGVTDPMLLKRADFERVGFTAPLGEPWLKVPHGVKTLENLIELLYCRSNAGCFYRRHNGLISETSRKYMRKIIRNLYVLGQTPITEFVGNGFGWDERYLYYEDFGALENVLIAAFIHLLISRTLPSVLKRKPDGYKVVEQWKYYLCCTEHALSVNKMVTCVSENSLISACAPWLRDNPKFYSPGWYNTRSVGYVFLASDCFEFVFAKNIYSLANIGFCAVKHGEFDLTLPQATFVASSKKRDWGDHFTSWPGIIDDTVCFKYFSNAQSENVMLVRKGMLLQDIKDGQNEPYFWTGPADDLTCDNCCHNLHHMSTRQKDPCRVCPFLEKNQLPLTYKATRPYYSWVPEAAPSVAIDMLAAEQNTEDETFYLNWIDTFVFDRYQSSNINTNNDPPLPLSEENMRQIKTNRSGIIRYVAGVPKFVDNPWVV